MCSHLRVRWPDEEKKTHLPERLSIEVMPVSDAAIESPNVDKVEAILVI
jgi:hypothetical protein